MCFLYTFQDRVTIDRRKARVAYKIVRRAQKDLPGEKRSQFLSDYKYCDWERGASYTDMTMRVNPADHGYYCYKSLRYVMSQGVLDSDEEVWKIRVYGTVARYRNGYRAESFEVVERVPRKKIRQYQRGRK